jgi:hypothetical protein
MGLVSELVTWFADQGQRPVTVTIAVRAVDLERLLSKRNDGEGHARTATISTDRLSYGLDDTIHLTVQLRNPHRPDQFDGYLIGQGPRGTVWFYDGQTLSKLGEREWLAWSRKLPLPARATGRFSLRSSTLASGAYRWHVVLTESGTYRAVATGATAFTVKP